MSERGLEMIAKAISSIVISASRCEHFWSKPTRDHNIGWTQECVHCKKVRKVG